MCHHNWHKPICWPTVNLAIGIQLQQLVSSFQMWRPAMWRTIHVMHQLMLSFSHSFTIGPPLVIFVLSELQELLWCNLATLLDNLWVSCSSVTSFMRVFVPTPWQTFLMSLMWCPSYFRLMWHLPNARIAHHCMLSGELCTTVTVGG